jgi:flavin reductase (DIM6/NTAB) family NADH-FMN oxidoreductase RutF
MSLKPIPIHEFSARIFDLFDNHWLLLTSGDFKTGHYNAMTISWGSAGILWNKPFVQVVVRPTRFTYEFMEKYETFTLCAFPETYRKAMQLLGSKSGRDGDKIAASKLTPLAAHLVAAPLFAEAHLVLECRKIYWQDLDPAHFLDPPIEGNYPHKDYHRAWFGEVLGIYES